MVLVNVGRVLVRFLPIFLMAPVLPSRYLCLPYQGPSRSVSLYSSCGAFLQYWYAWYFRCLSRTERAAVYYSSTHRQTRVRGCRYGLSLSPRVQFPTNFQHIARVFSSYIPPLSRSKVGGGGGAVTGFRRAREHPHRMYSST